MKKLGLKKKNYFTISYGIIRIRVRAGNARDKILVNLIISVAEFHPGMQENATNIDRVLYRCES